MKTVCVTGGAGFIGSHVVELLLASNYRVITVDKLTYAGDLANLNAVHDHPNHTFLQMDICDQALIFELFEHYEFDGVFHLAAESHVDNSISGPQAFIETNVMGTFNLLEAARKSWLKESKKDSRFLHVSTDEVYGSLGPKGYFTEQSPYQPNSPYSASKASSDMLVRSYNKTYGLNTVITNCSNNYGPRQHHEKLIPTVIKAALNNKPIPVYGQGTNIRDWLFVTDHSTALKTVYEKGAAGEVYNIGTHHELTNLELVTRICRYLDELVPSDESYEQLITFVGDRPGHDFRYAIDPSKIHQLGWKPSHSFEEALRATLRWYLSVTKHPKVEVEA